MGTIGIDGTCVSRRVCHVTSAHPRYDTRIYYKQCRSLVAAGYSVSLVVADGRGDETCEGVRILDVGRAANRLLRILRTTRLALRRASETKSVIYHLHDPELMHIGLRLRRRGKIVLFDAHEDLPKQVLSKEYLPRPLRAGLSTVLGRYQRWILSRFHAIVAATPRINGSLASANSRCVTVANYPLLGELAKLSDRDEERPQAVCYVGGLERIRGTRELVQAVGRVRNSVRLFLAGSFTDSSLLEELAAHPGWERVDFRGWLDRDGVRDVLHHSLAGIVTLHPKANYVDALPVKMFEYMSAGLPVIASDFPLWQEIVCGNQCGICVDPMSPDAIARAIDRLSENPDEARRLGRNGQRAVEQRYNWAVEKEKLLDLYAQLFRRNRRDDSGAGRPRTRMTPLEPESP